MAVGSPRPARGSRVQRRPNRGSLVRRVDRRVPRLWDRRRAAGWRVAAVPEWFTNTMLALNITVGGTIVFTLLALFANQRRDALAALRDEQARAESLLLNILPRSIADRLKAETQTIADQFSSASILFADVVDFTPLARTPSAGRGRRCPRPPVQPLRRSRRALRGREDQDDRRLLHGRRGRPLAPARPRPCARTPGARHADSDALGRRGRATRARVARSGSTPGQSWPA